MIIIYYCVYKLAEQLNIKKERVGDRKGRIKYNRNRLLVCVIIN